MATIKTRWEGPRRKAELMEALRRRLSAAAIVVAAHAKRLVSEAGTGQGRSAKTGKFARVYGANPSRPGDPPHKQTGRLRASIAWELVGAVARVGTNLPYGRWLEHGTRKMAARPWLRRALSECRARVLAILSKPLN